MIRITVYGAKYLGKDKNGFEMYELENGQRFTYLGGKTSTPMENSLRKYIEIVPTTLEEEQRTGYDVWVRVYED